MAWSLMSFSSIQRTLNSTYDSISLLDANRFCIQLSQQKTGYLIVFTTLTEIQRCFNFLKKARENQLELYKVRKYDIKVNVDFFSLYLGKLEALERDLQGIVQYLYNLSKVINPTEHKSIFRKFSYYFNHYLVAFHGKITMEPRFLAIFLKVFQNFFFERFIETVIANKMKDVSSTAEDSPRSR